jgi:hypothetical protein
MKSLRSVAACVALVLSALAPTVRGETLRIDAAEVAGIAGFRGMWDRPLMLAPDGEVVIIDLQEKEKHGTAHWGGENPGAIAFDALQRQLLVRFPDAAEQIAAKVNQGLSIEKVELVLPFKDHELWPPGDPDRPTPTGYTFRRNWGVDDMYRKIPPRWHAVASVLRRPWKADPQHGPTFNAFVNGAGYWAKYGAGDEQHDRFPQRFGPAEVSQDKNDAIDVTALLTDAAYGDSLGRRLRVLSEQGFIVQKWEIYDHRYFNGAYEWATATGGRGIRIDPPRLVVTFKRGAVERVDLPPATDLMRLAQELKSTGKGGQPTAVMPTEQQIKAFTEKVEARPDWMPPWQYQRMHELRDAVPRLAGQPLWYTYINHTIYGTTLSRRTRDAEGREVVHPPTLVDAYGGWVDTLISRQPRGWSGFESGPEMTQWYLHGEHLPGPARDAIAAYWSAWLMPDRDTAPTEEQRRNFRDDSGLLVHPMADDGRVGGPEAKNPDPGAGRYDTYYAKTGDWRGNKSFFRSGFNYTMSTQNFNTTAASGALLAGALLNAEKPIADGRYGFEHFPLRMWAWGAGHSQELVDHYYLAVTLSGQKAVADFGPTPFDRQMGHSAMLKTIQEITSVWHPGLSRFISGSSRTSLEYLFAKQDGVIGVMHAMSPDGALMDLGRKLPGNIEPLGSELAPNRVALQTLSGPWAPDWQMDLVQNKPLPFEARSIANGSMQTSFLGQNFGLASNDHSAKRISTMAQWKRDARPAQRMEDIVTMNLRYGSNDTRFANDSHGWIAHHGTVASLQHRGKLLAIGSPVRSGGGNLQSFAEKNPITSLQTSIALFNFEEPRTWEMYAGDRKVDKLPFTLNPGESVTIRDGVTFFAATPIAGTDLGRDAVAVIREGDEQTWQQVVTKPAIVIDVFNYRKDQPLPADVDWQKIDRAWSGFAVQIADAAEFGNDFAAFRRHVASGTVVAENDEKADTVTATWISGDDTLEMKAQLTPPFDRPGKDVLLARTINGQPAALPDQLERDTTTDQQGRSGRLEKNGAVIVNERGSLAALMTNPQKKVYVGLIPLPDKQLWAMTTPGGITVTADDRLGMSIVTVDETTNHIDIQSHVKPEDVAKDGGASAFLVRGLPAGGRITHNGSELSGFQTQNIGGQPTVVIPIHPDRAVRPLGEIEDRLQRFEQLMSRASWPDFMRMQLLDWWIVGPFPQSETEEFGPERTTSLDDMRGGHEFKGIDGQTVRWQPISPHAALFHPQPHRGIEVFRAPRPENNHPTNHPEPITGYLGVGLRSEREQEVSLNLSWWGSSRGSTITLFLNGEEVKSNPVRLNAGDNVVVLRTRQKKAADTGDPIRFNIGDPIFGIPTVTGVQFVTPNHVGDVNPIE